MRILSLVLWIGFGAVLTAFGIGIVNKPVQFLTIWSIVVAIAIIEKKS